MAEEYDHVAYSNRFELRFLVICAWLKTLVAGHGVNSDVTFCKMQNICCKYFEIMVHYRQFKALTGQSIIVNYVQYFRRCPPLQARRALSGG